MGVLTDIKDAVKALVVAAVPDGTAVLVGCEPEAVDIERFPKFVIIVLDSNPYSDNITIGAVTQWSEWNWSLYSHAGSPGTNEDALDALDPLYTAVTGLAGSTVLSYSKPIEIREAWSFYTWHPSGSPVYKTQITHEQQPQ